MQIVVADSETDFYEKAALRIAQEIRKNPAAKIGLSTGRTTKGVHAALAGMYQESPFDCSATLGCSRISAVQQPPKRFSQAARTFSTSSL